MPAQEISSTATARTVRALILLTVCGVALFNGSIWSPFYDSVAYVLYLATRGYPMMSAARAADITPVAIAAMTLLIAGIPAAIYERARGLHGSTAVSIGIWLIATLLLTLPTIMNALEEG